jgi:hypothetical protein
LRLVREILSLESLQIGEILEHKYRDMLYRVESKVEGYAMLIPEGDDIYSGIKINKILVNEAGLRSYERVGQV